MIIKYYFLSVVKYQRRRNCYQFHGYQCISLYLLVSCGALILLTVKTLINYMKLYQIHKLKWQCYNLVYGGKKLITRSKQISMEVELNSD